jgi:hypothetical protein
MYALEDIVRMNNPQHRGVAPAVQPVLDNAIPAEDQVTYETAQPVTQ